jgi:hypothetical protein
MTVQYRSRFDPMGYVNLDSNPVVHGSVCYLGSVCGCSASHKLIPHPPQVSRQAALRLKTRTSGHGRGSAIEGPGLSSSTWSARSGELSQSWNNSDMPRTLPCLTSSVAHSQAGGCWNVRTWHATVRSFIVGSRRRRSPRILALHHNTGQVYAFRSAGASSSTRRTIVGRFPEITELAIV